MHLYLARVPSIVASRRFFFFTLGLCIVQAVWIACTAQYPMAFDEDFHFGLIQLYAAHHWPFWQAQPDGGAAFGALTRDPSYLFHYLMSFPYRLVAHFTDTVAAQVLVLRFINVAMAATGLVLFRRLFMRVAVPNAITNLSLLILTLLPVTSQLIAQINYDNAVLMLLPAVVLLSMHWYQRLKSGEPAWLQLGWIVLLCMLLSLIKYAFLPIALAVAAFVVASLIIFRKSNRVSFGLPKQRAAWLCMLALLLLCAGLFAERYGVNIAHYHKPIPDCAQVLDVKQCMEYGPWRRNYNLEQTKQLQAVAVDTSPVGYMDDWLYGMWMRTFFALGGPLVSYQTRGPLPVPSLAAVLFIILSVAVAVWALPRFWRDSQRPFWLLCVGIIALYIAALWLAQYQDYVQTGKPVAINGRYLIPIAPFMFVIIGRAWSWLLNGHRTLAGLMIVLVICALAWGGGALTYILRSNDTWYWRNSPLTPANHFVQRTLGPVTPGYEHATQFLR